MTRDDRPVVGTELPMALDARDMARIFGVALNTVYEWKKDGKLRRFELRQQIGTKYWSGRLVKNFLDGQGPSLAAARRSA